MKKKPLIIFFTLLVSAVVILCVSLFNNVSAQDLTKNLTPKKINNTLPDKSYINSYNNFSSNLFIASAENKGNVLISPASVYLALAMTVNGADNETKTEMLNALASNGITLDMLNLQSSNLISELKTSTDKTSLSVANCIWYDKEFTPDNAFLQTDADYYGAALNKLDFKDTKSADVINKWVSDSTNGKIDKIVDKIDESTVMYLINTIYFKSEWQSKFNKNNTRQMTFHTPAGGVEVDFLNKTGGVDYISGNNAKGVVLNYENDKFAYFAIMPDNNATPRQWISSQGDKLFSNIFSMISAKQTKSAELYMPKFETKYQDSIKNELEKLGIKKAFDANSADLSLMNKDHVKNLYISEVLHKTYIKIDENGTEAAAATSVEVSLTAMPSSDMQLKFDKPFIYGIVDLTSGSVIFAGIMENPS